MHLIICKYLPEADTKRGCGAVAILELKNGVEHCNAKEKVGGLIWMSILHGHFWLVWTLISYD